LERRELTPAQTTTLFDELMSGRVGDAEAAALLIALRMKGETANELAAAARVLRSHMNRLETGRGGVLDTCGTGGDGTGTFNISTAAALVAAAAGVPVVKHGNRAISGATGSADVLAELGVHVEAGPAWARRCLDVAGIAFCFAPHYHPTMKQVASVRKRLGVRTIFNLLGPLANPAGAAYQLLGVGRPELLEPVAGALAQLGIKQAFVVCGRDGLDEVSLTAPTRVRRVVENRVEVEEWTIADFGLEPVSIEEIAVANPAESAAMIRDVLSGRPSAARRVVLANAAAAILVAQHAPNLQQAVRLAERAIDTGRARETLAALTVASP
jgi:anthranilate phosphoribosyltransferase